MSIFVDTSALYALLDKDDGNPAAARGVRARLKEEAAERVTTHSVLVETLALVQSRMGLEAVLEFSGKIYPLLDVVVGRRILVWRCTARHLKERKRLLSMVDCLSLEVTA